MATKKKSNKSSKPIKKDDLNKKINNSSPKKSTNTTKKNTNSKPKNNAKTNPNKKVNNNQKPKNNNIPKNNQVKKTNTTKKNPSNNKVNKQTPKKTNTTKKPNNTPKKPQNTKIQPKEEKKQYIEPKEERIYSFDDKVFDFKKESEEIKVNKKNDNIFKRILNALLIVIVGICKGLLICVKFIKNFIEKQYNSIKRKRKRKKQVNAIRRDEIENNELVLLKYRDYPFYGYLYVFLVNRIRVMKFDMKNFKKKFKYGTLKDKILIIFMMFLILGFSLFVAFCIFIIVTAPEVTEEKLYRNTTTVLLDKDDKEFARIGAENRENVGYEDLPEVLIDAIVATEDSRFFQHNGIDIARFTKAAVGQLLGHSDAGGGSTLTMQVSKKAATSTESHGIKGIIRKFTDIYLAVFVLEQRYTKEQIMEFYVNINYLGSRAYGVQQASKTYFGKEVSELTLAEAALLAGLFQAPDYLDPRKNPEGAEERRNTVLNLMYRHDYITEEERDNAQSIPVEGMLTQTVNKEETDNIGFIDTLVADVEDKTGFNPYVTPMIIHTTYDMEKQKVINDVYDTYKFQDDYVQVGVAVTDVETGAIVAVGAGRNKTGVSQFNYAKARRHPGSVAKPVIDYGPAIEYLGWSTGTTVIDDEYGYSSGGAIKNFDDKFKGILTVKKALAQSRNVPALYTFQQTTNEQKLDFARSLGWSPEVTPNGTMLESDSIGGFKGVTAIEASAAYGAFARGGIYIEPYTYTEIEFEDSEEVIEYVPKKKQVMSEETAYIITMILKYAVTSGTVTAANKVSGTDICGKTGTSTIDSATLKELGLKGNIVGDSWEVTFSPDYVIAMWQGYENTVTKEHYLLNSQAVKTRNGVSRALGNGIFEKNSRFKQPAGVTSAVIELETDPIKLASAYTPDNLKSTELFKKGTEPMEVSNRFDTLQDPSNLRYSSTTTSVTLAWDAAPYPDAINQTYLLDYFNNSPVYKTWAEKYFKKRVEYNNATFGNFGYHVYLVNSSGTYDLGFTTSTQFTANVQFDSSTRFVVKSSYQKFTANQSPGLTINVQPNYQGTYIPPTPDDNTTEANVNLSIIYKGKSSCSTLDDYNSLGNSISDKVRIEANGVDVTNQSNVSINCYLADDDNDQGGHCSEMKAGTNYRLEITAVYRNKRRMAIVNIKPSC